ncbi:carboxypeptidase-like regulatory domain-containing protein [Micromonospora sp. NPDC049559]|uniref:carboxypeptidase-like regulatory domain-containing protein n=1 Tax=Micromonospora sp. NPDC049559 TaxID=3155923 RepID=UPI0034321502
MGRSFLRGLGLVTTGLLVAASATAVPAAAAAETGTIAGTITRDGVPVPNVQVDILEPKGPNNAHRVTGPDGRYEATGMSTTAYYQVKITPPGGIPQWAYGKLGPDQAAQFRVAAGQVTTVDDELVPVGTIAGRFVDAAGRGIATEVHASGPDGPPNSTRSDADGNYSIPVVPGRYMVQFASPGNADQYAHGTYDYREAALFAVTANRTTTVDEVKLPVGTLRGRVTTADGAPADGVEVYASGGPSPGVWVTTDATGAYELRDMVPGQYRLSYRLPGSRARQWAPQVLTEAAARVFTVGPDAVTTHDERLLPTGGIAGRFTDERGAGLQYVTVRLSRADTPDTVTAQTGADGTYRLDGVFTGEYQVHFSGPHGVDQWAYGKPSEAEADPITIARGATTTVDDGLPLVGSVAVEARDSVTGAPIDEFSVSVADSSTQGWDGLAYLWNVPVGTWPLTVSSPHHADAAATVTVAVGEMSRVEVLLRPVRQIRPSGPSRPATPSGPRRPPPSKIAG